jgi:hypothetical protein
MSKPNRIWLPVDANFTRDPDILKAGERAGWLYLAILGQIKMSGAAGVITAAEVKALGLRDVQSRLPPLVRYGLLERTNDPDVYWVPAWEAWQGNQDRATYMREWRSRAKRKIATVDHPERPQSDR